MATFTNTELVQGQCPVGLELIDATESSTKDSDVLLGQLVDLGGLLGRHLDGS